MAAGLAVLERHNDCYIADVNGDEIMDHFSLTQSQMNQNGVLPQVVKAAVIRDIAEGIIPDRQNINGRVPFNLMKSEKLLWVMTGVDYLKVVIRRERRAVPTGPASTSPVAPTGPTPPAALRGSRREPRAPTAAYSGSPPSNGKTSSTSTAHRPDQHAFINVLGIQDSGDTSTPHGTGPSESNYRDSSEERKFTLPADDEGSNRAVGRLGYPTESKEKVPGSGPGTCGFLRSVWNHSPIESRTTDKNTTGTITK